MFKESQENEFETVWNGYFSRFSFIVSKFSHHELWFKEVFSFPSVFLIRREVNRETGLSAQHSWAIFFRLRGTSPSKYNVEFINNENIKNFMFSDTDSTNVYVYLYFHWTVDEFFARQPKVSYVRWLGPIERDLQTAVYNLGIFSH